RLRARSFRCINRTSDFIGYRNLPPDGYTLLLAVSTTAVNAALYTNLNFNFIRDVAPVASIGGTPFVMVFNPSFPAKTIPEFIAYTKANPGKVNMGSQGIIQAQAQAAALSLLDAAPRIGLSLRRSNDESRVWILAAVA